MDLGTMRPREGSARLTDVGEPIQPSQSDAGQLIHILVLDDAGIVLAVIDPEPENPWALPAGELEGRSLADLLGVDHDSLTGAIGEAIRQGATSLIVRAPFFAAAGERPVGRLFSFTGSRPTRLVLVVHPDSMALQTTAGAPFGAKGPRRTLVHESYRAHVDSRSLLIWRSDPDGRAIEVNCLGDFRLSIGASLERADWLGLVYPQDRETVMAHSRQWLEAGFYRPIQFRMLHSAGYYRLVQSRGVPVRGRGGEILEWIGTISEVEDPEDTGALRESETRLRLVLQASRMALWQVELATGQVMWSREARELAGVGPDTRLFPGLYEQLVHPDDRAVVSRSVQALRRDGGAKAYEITYRICRADTGEIRWVQECARLLFDQDGKPQRIVGATKDVTATKQAEEKLVHAVNHDALTGLLNRRAMQSALAETVRKVLRTRGQGSLMVLDIDAFRTINDSFGQAAGDTLLRITAMSLEASVGDRGWVARLSGDAFAIALHLDAGAENARILAERMLTALARPFRYRGVTMVVRACIGIAAFPDDASDPLAVLHYAEMALDHAKKIGRSQIRVFEPEMLRVVERRLALVRDIGAALDAEQIAPFYQPKIDLRTGRIVGFEALARWNKSQSVSLTPQVFAAAFQDPYLAAAIDAAMLRRVMLDLSGWQKQGLTFGRVALNVSSSTLRAQGILESFLRQIDIADVSPDQIQIEVTESVLLDRDAEDVAALLRRFRSNGIRISLDDFGTGYASLLHLKHFPVDELKIDQSFVRNLERDQGDAAILSAVINLGRSLDIVTVAEGIETQGQAMQLRSWGCDLGQGFLFASAVPASMVPGLLLGPPLGSPVLEPPVLEQPVLEPR